jgi:hypothetical protein
MALLAAIWQPMGSSNRAKLEAGGLRKLALR